MTEHALAHSTETFPLRVAAIDVGSNAIRFMAVEFLDSRNWIELETQRVPIRLGRNAFLSGNLDENAMAAAVAAMSAFRRAIDTHDVGLYRAVATSAVRESRNGGELAERIRGESGIQLETITGSEEARLVSRAVRDRLPLDADYAILADLGGGSLEISLIGRDGVVWSESYTIGTVRLLEEFSGAQESPKELSTLIEEYLGTLRIPDLPPCTGPDGRREPLIASGGNIEVLAKLAGISPGENRVSVLAVRILRESIGSLAGLSYDERIARFGLSANRADVILPAALVYLRVAELAGTDEIMVPHVGLKEGILLDLVEDLVQHSTH